MNLRTRSATGLVVVAIAAAAARAQYQIDWVVHPDGPHQSSDLVSAVAVDAAGATYIAGSAVHPQSPPPPDEQRNATLTKLDANGALVWQQSQYLQVPIGSFDGVAVSATGDVYATGSYFGDKVTLQVVKYSSSGAWQWIRTLQSPGSAADHGAQLDFDASGNLLVLGTWHAGQWLVAKYDPSGSLLWTWKSGPGLDGQPRDFAVDAQGDVFVTGTLQANSAKGVRVARVDSNGALAWMSNLTPGVSGIATALDLTADGRLLVTGHVATFATFSQGFVAELDPQTGATLWMAPVQPAIGAQVQMLDVAVASDGVAWAVGRDLSGPALTSSIARFDASGTPLGQTQLPGGSSNARQVFAGGAGQVWVCGTTNAGASTPLQPLVAQFDAAGALNWSVQPSATPSALDVPVEYVLATPERIVVGGYNYDNPTGNADLYAASLSTADSPHAYCTAKVNSQGCTPRIEFLGQSSVASTSGFEIVAHELRNQVSGLFFYGATNAASIPYQGGTLCLVQPFRRSPMLVSGGSAFPAIDCSGALQLDFNAFAAGAAGGSPGVELGIAGTTIRVQAWSRDPGASFNSSLSNALRYVVLP